MSNWSPSSGMDSIRTTRAENVVLQLRYPSNTTIPGNLSIVVTHLIFNETIGQTSPKNVNKSEGLNSLNGKKKKPREIMIAMSLIWKVDKQTPTPNGTPLVLLTKNFRSLTFYIPKEQEAHNLFTAISECSRPNNLDELYAFLYTINGVPRHTPDVYTLEGEYRRMGILHSEQWRIDDSNKDFFLSDTYPASIVVPILCNKFTIEGSAKFRSRGRLPALTYLHKNGAAICRSSQPLVGMVKVARSTEDEDFLAHIAKNSPCGKKILLVVDTRPRANAMVNKAQGKGYELEEYYPFIRLQFDAIENIHVMRSSMQKIVEMCEKRYNTMAAYLSDLSSSGWLRHIRCIVDSAANIARSVLDGVNVLVHCSDGWDRTSQVCSVAQILLDPYYRTFDGFMALIEKDWISFGHKFTHRCNFLAGDNREESPVFTQFLDCVWQLMNQFPTIFQFNELFLIEIHTELYTCRFGTFLGNNEKERMDYKLKEKTHCLWYYMQDHRASFVNPFYHESRNNGPVTVDLSASKFRFWSHMYKLWDTPTQQTPESILTRLNKQNAVLLDHYKYLEKKVRDLNKMLGMEDRTREASDVLSKLRVSEDGLMEPEESIESGVTLEMFPADAVEVSISDSSSGNWDTSITANYVIGLSWEDTITSKNCPICMDPLEPIFSKVHCVRCGKIHCGKQSTDPCIEMRPLPELLSSNKVPICKSCSSSAAEVSQSPAGSSSKFGTRFMVKLDAPKDVTSSLESSMSSLSVDQSLSACASSSDLVGDYLGSDRQQDIIDPLSGSVIIQRDAASGSSQT